MEFERWIYSPLTGERVGINDKQHMAEIDAYYEKEKAEKEAKEEAERHAKQERHKREMAEHDAREKVRLSPEAEMIAALMFVGSATVPPAWGDAQDRDMLLRERIENFRLMAKVWDEEREKREAQRAAGEK